jgi:hypothetical protein
MTTAVSFPVDQVVEFEAMVSVDTTRWWCRLCGQEGTVKTTPQATDDAVAHLGTDHGGMRTSETPADRRSSPAPPLRVPGGQPVPDQSRGSHR